MCTMIAHQVKIQGRGKNGPEWFEVREANVSYDHPYDLPLEHALNIDFVNEALGPGARVAVELSVEAARELVKTVEAVLAHADQRGVLEDRPLAASPTRDRTVAVLTRRSAAPSRRRARLTPARPARSCSSGWWRSPRPTRARSRRFPPSPRSAPRRPSAR